MRFRLKERCGKHHTRSQDGEALTLRPGDIIDCEATELGNAIDKFEQLDPDPPEPQATEGLVVVPAGEGRFNIVNVVSGAKLNDVPLTSQEASDIAGVPAHTFSEPVVAGDVAQEEAEAGADA